MQTYGFNPELCELLREWLSGRRFVVEIDGSSSDPMEIDLGTIQGSILGPTLFAIYIRPVVTKTKKNSIYYADDGYLYTRCANRLKLMSNLKQILKETIIAMSQRGMVVNAQKTKVMLISRHDFKRFSISIEPGHIDIKVDKTMSILGVTLDSKMSWIQQAEQAIKNSAFVNLGIRAIKKWCTKQETVLLVKALLVPKMLYGEKIWLTNALPNKLKKQLNSRIVQALRKNRQDWTPTSLLLTSNGLSSVERRIFYNNALNLYTTLNNPDPDEELARTLNNYIDSRRSGTLAFTSDVRFKMLKSRPSNQFWTLNGKIEQNDVYMDEESYKRKMKRLFLTDQINRY